ncbi:MAG: hypothetical protein AB1546_03965, partial [bacterium]
MPKVVRFLKLTSLLFLSFALFLVSLFFYLSLSEEKPAFNTAEAEKISFSPLERIVPGDRIPAGLKIFRSNNNLDLVRYKGRYYLAFRTAPTHFASSKTIIYVLSSTDYKKWEYETEYNLNSDLREPRFLIFKNRLFLYFFQGGSNPLSFAPEHIFATERISKSNWEKPKPIYKPGFVVWRAKEYNGRAYMSVYYGVGLYSNEKQPGHLQLLVSDDGYNYELINNREVSNEASTEEGEFEFDENGNLYATVRLEMKGGKVCAALKDDITEWR